MTARAMILLMALVASATAAPKPTALPLAPPGLFDATPPPPAPRVKVRPPAPVWQPVHSVVTCTPRNEKPVRS